MGGAGVRRYDYGVATDRPTLLLRGKPHRAPSVRPVARAPDADLVLRALQLQQLIGNRTTAQLMASPVVQRELELGALIQHLLRGVETITVLGSAAVSVLADVASGTEPSAAVVRQVLRAGVSEEDVTDLVLFARHPELGGRKLGKDDAELIGEWKSIRSTLVRPLLHEIEEARRRHAEEPGSKGGDAPSEPSAPGGGGGDLLADTDRSYLATLPGGNTYLSFDWHPLDYPGKKVKITDTSAENLDKLRADRQIELYQQQGTWYIRGVNQGMAKKLFAFLAKHVPERRANSGTHAVLTKKEFAKNPEVYDAYIVGQLTAIPSQSSLKLNRHAAAAFDAMVQAAKVQGVGIRASNSFRDRKKAQKNAAKAGNASAVAGYSSHSLGLAVDLLLHTAPTKGQWTETSTRMDNLVKMYRSPAYKWMAEHGADHGWYPFRNEPWHWEYNPEGFRKTFFAELDAGHRPGA